MPSKSKAQHNFMEMIAHNPAMAKKKGVPQSVGREFEKADKGKKFREGGSMKKESMKEDIKQDKAIIKKAFKMHDKQEHKGEHTDLSKLKKGGMAMKKMAKGGMAKESMGPRSMKEDVEKGSNKHGSFGESKLQKSGQTRGMNLGDSGKTEKIETGKNMKSFMDTMKKGGKVKKYAHGGSIHESSMGKVKTNTKAPHGDGIAERGKTRAMMPKMKGRII